jgi:poly-gamma-glutamate synthesis protein (capsule biosynthesis protein)
MINILIAGDFCPRHRIEKLINEGKYESVFGKITPIISKMDYSVVNLEAPIVIKDAKPIKKSGPNLKCSLNSLDAIKYAGFDMVTLANNHILDYGEEGMQSTLSSLMKNKIDYVGGGKNIKEASVVFYKEVKNKKFAFVNFCENEFSIATEKTAGANPLNIISNYHQIQEAKQNADYVIVIVHGGHEYYQLPSPRMKTTYRFFIDNGASVVINHHQHCISGYERYKNGLIFYGIGNFCFDWENHRNGIWNEGYMVNLNFNEDKCIFELLPYIQCNNTPDIEIMKDKTIFNNSIEKLNAIIASDDLLQESFEEFCIKASKNIKLVFEPYSNRYLMALYNRRLLPSFITKKKKIILLNLVRCESHYDILKNVLFREYKDNYYNLIR